jgi:DNA-binding NtrC family response regulator
MRRFLLLDDEINVLHAMRRVLRSCFSGDDLRIEIFTDPEQALLRAGEVAFDIVISDYRMPGMNGVDFLSMVKGIQPDAVRLLLSASTEFETVMSAVNRAEVFRYIAKPWQPEDIKTALELALARRDQIAADQQLADELRVQRGQLTPQEIESKRLEAEEPGITKVNWGPDGSVHLE